jgi:SOS-response transcriptional repressor LexA
MAAAVVTDVSSVPLTDRQRDVLAMLHEWARDKGFQPSYRDMAARFGIHTCNGIQRHLKALAHKGYLRFDGNGQGRAIRIVYLADGTLFRGFLDKPSPGSALIPGGLELTRRQREVLEAIYNSVRDKGFQPTVKELIVAQGVHSPNAIHLHLRAMVEHGWIRLHFKARAVEFILRPDGHKFTGFLDRPAPKGGAR